MHISDFALQQHLFLTEEEEAVVLDDLIRVVYVIIRHQVPDVGEWCRCSPDHFYVRWGFPALSPTAWAQRTKLTNQDTLDHCQACFAAKEQEICGPREDYADAMGHRPIRTMDLFAGVGAFSGALADAADMEVTHAVEISPSAAITLK